MAVDNISKLSGLGNLEQLANLKSLQKNLSQTVGMEIPLDGSIPNIGNGEIKNIGQTLEKPSLDGTSSPLGGLGNPKSSFAETLGSFVQDVNAQQLESGKKTEQFIAGEDVDLHDVMIASQKAKTSFSLLLELRNKALDMYREVIRMPV